MDNQTIRKLLERQRDTLYDKLKETSITGLYKQEYEDIKAGRAIVFDNGERRLLIRLKKLSKDTSFDGPFKSKLNEYLALDNESLTTYFQTELERIFIEIKGAGKQDDIQACLLSMITITTQVSSSVMEYRNIR